ncbi:MAG: PilN domain-containing protein [Rhodanobacter sp.]
MSSASQTLRPQIDRVRRAWCGSPLPGFFTWWGSELRALLPVRWQTLLGGGATWCLLQHEDDQWVLYRSGQPQSLARWSDTLDAPAQQAALAAATTDTDRQDLRLALCLPAAAVLRRRLLLPIAARDNLRQVGAYEMDRQTPFRAEQVHYDLRELTTSSPEGRAPEGRVAVELVAVPRGVLDTQLALLKEASIAVDAADLRTGVSRLGVDLLPRDQAHVRRDPRRRLNLALAAGIVLLVLLCLLQWLHNREAALIAMQSEVDSMRTEAQQVSNLRKQLQDSAGAAGFLVRRKTDAPTVLGLLQELTARLPDDTWLERLTVDNSGQVGFQGQSAKAAQLVDLLQGSQLITGANFQGVIQRDAVTGKERFYMNAQLHAPTTVKPSSPSNAPAAKSAAPNAKAATDAKSATPGKGVAR